MILPLLGHQIASLWYMLPLIVSVSLVYAATRHELLVPILRHAARFALWIGVFMGIVLGILMMMSWAVSGEEPDPLEARCPKQVRVFCNFETGEL